MMPVESKDCASGLELHYHTNLLAEEHKFLKEQAHGHNESMDAIVEDYSHSIDAWRRNEQLKKRKKKV